MNRRLFAALGVLALAAVLIWVFVRPMLEQHGKLAPEKLEPVLVAPAQWPLTGVSGILTRADRLMRAKWQDDAVPMVLDAKPAPGGGVDLELQYYSPGARLVRGLHPTGVGDGLEAEQPGNRDTRQSIPPEAADLSAALSKAGLGPGDIENAELAWAKSGGFEGVQWKLTPAGGSPRYVPATAP